MSLYYEKKLNREVLKMHNFTYFAPTKLYFGKNVIENLGSEIKALGDKVLLVYGGGSIKKTGIYNVIKEQLQGCEVFELSGVDPNPRVTSVNQGAALCKQHGIEVVLAVGGGSVMDCSKAICAAAKYAGDDAWDLVKNSSLVKEALPLICVVTIAATGSEFDCGGVISNLSTNEKMGLVNPHLWPKVSFIDPSYTCSVSKYQTTAGSCDIMSHYMEQYFTTGVNDIGDGFLETELKTVIKYTPAALENGNDYEARAHLMWAATLGCNRMTSLGNDPSIFVCHAIEHELSAFHDITHGIGLAIITPKVMRYILNDKSVNKLAQFAHNVMHVENSGDAYADAKAGISALEKFFASIGVPEGLSNIGVDDTHFKAMAEHACAYNPLHKAFIPLNESDVEAILRQSL